MAPDGRYQSRVSEWIMKMSDCKPTSSPPWRGQGWVHGFGLNVAPFSSAGGRGRSGFTLIEVSLAVMVVGLGLLTVFSLFPSGLRSAEEGVADTKCGLFAETMLNGMHANASTITNWNDWANPSTFINITTNNVVGVIGSVASVTFPAGGTEMNRYRLTLDTSNNKQYGARLEVWNGVHGPLTYPSVFYSEFVFEGL